MPIVIKLRKSEFFGYKINEDNILLLVNVYHDHCNLKVIQIGRKIRKLHFSVRSSHRQIWNYFVNFSDFHCVSRAIRRGCVCVCVCHRQWQPSNRSIRITIPAPAGDGPVVLMSAVVVVVMVMVMVVVVDAVARPQIP